jgi:hypothetical protein
VKVDTSPIFSCQSPLRRSRLPRQRGNQHDPHGDLGVVGVGHPPQLMPTGLLDSLEGGGLLGGLAARSLSSCSSAAATASKRPPAPRHESASGSNSSVQSTITIRPADSRPGWPALLRPAQEPGPAAAPSRWTRPALADWPIRPCAMTPRRSRTGPAGNAAGHWCRIRGRGQGRIDPGRRRGNGRARGTASGGFCGAVGARRSSGPGCLRSSSRRPALQSSGPAVAGRPRQQDHRVRPAAYLS